MSDRFSPECWLEIRFLCFGLDGQILFQFFFFRKKLFVKLNLIILDFIIRV